MRIYLLFVLFTFWATLSCAQVISDFYPGGKPHGKVLKVITARYNRNHANKIMHEPDTTTRDTTWFNNTSDAISYIVHHVRTGDALVYRYVNSYTSEGKLITTIRYGNDRRSVIHYNADGIVTDVTDSLYNSQNLIKDIYLYDDKRKTAVKETYNDHHQLIGKMVYRFNHKQLITSEAMLEGPFRYSIQNRYSKFDKSGNWTRKISTVTQQVAFGTGVSIDTVARQITYQ